LSSDTALFQQRGATKRIFYSAIIQSKNIKLKLGDGCFKKKEMLVSLITSHILFNYPFVPKQSLFNIEAAKRILQSIVI